MQPCCEPNISWKVLEMSFVSTGKPLNLVFASPQRPEKQYFTVCMNPEYHMEPETEKN